MSLKSMFALLCLLLGLGGCRSAPVAENFVGRWLEEGERTFIDFGPEHLYALYNLEKPVEVGTWELNDGRIRLKPLTEGEEREWQIGTVEKTFRVRLNEARFREFRKAPANSLFDERLAGLWISGDEPADVMEFTPHGTMIGFVWRKDETEDLFTRGAWGKLSTAGTNKFFLEGHMGAVFLTKSTVHSYQMEDNRLVWDSGGNKRKLRKITSVDQIPSDKGQR